MARRRVRHRKPRRKTVRAFGGRYTPVELALAGVGAAILVLVLALIISAIAKTG